jgi:poly [ADP-ribose] polymerase
MVTGENNNKYYDMDDDGNTIHIKYGRVGVTEQTGSYPSGKWDSLRNSKVKKGYKDVTHLFAEEVTNAKGFVDISDSAIKVLIDRLQAYAKKQVSTYYNITADKVTKRQVDEAQLILNQLLQCGDLSCFNKYLLELFMIIPRRMADVRRCLPTSFTQDNANIIITKEQDLLDTMASQVSQIQLVNDNTEDNVTLLDAMGLEILPTTSSDENLIKSKLQDLANQYDGSFIVRNRKTKKKFDEFVAKKDNKKVELFWHGSRNENWISILETGLLLRPTNAVTNGKMFGYGSYAADKARKSYGYTSGRGSYWANGNSNEAYMAMFNFHVGNQLHIKKHESWCYNLTEENLKKRGNYDSLFAEGGIDLRNNEFIVYNENQTNIEYIVRLKG